LSDSKDQPATSDSTDVPAPTSEYVSPLKLDKPEAAGTTPSPQTSSSAPGGSNKPTGETKGMDCSAVPSGSHKPVPDTKQFVSESTVAKN